MNYIQQRISLISEYLALYKNNKYMPCMCCGTFCSSGESLSTT